MKFGKDVNDLTGECVKETVRLAILPLWSAYYFLTTYALADEAGRRPPTTSGRRRWSTCWTADHPARRRFSPTSPASTRPTRLRRTRCRTEIRGMTSTTGTSAGRRRYWRANNPADCRQAAAHATLQRCAGDDRAGDGAGDAVLHRAPVPAGWWSIRGLAVPGEESVHFTRFPEADVGPRDEAASSAWSRPSARSSALGLGLRERERIHVRRPLARLTIDHELLPEEPARFADPAVQEELKGELNVEEIAGLGRRQRAGRAQRQGRFQDAGRSASAAR